MSARHADQQWRQQAQDAADRWHRRFIESQPQMPDAWRRNYCRRMRWARVRRIASNVALTLAIIGAFALVWCRAQGVL